MSVRNAYHGLGVVGLNSEATCSVNTDFEEELKSLKTIHTYYTLLKIRNIEVNVVIITSTSISILCEHILAIKNNDIEVMPINNMF